MRYVIDNGLRAERVVQTREPNVIRPDDAEPLTQCALKLFAELHYAGVTSTRTTVVGVTTPSPFATRTLI